MIKFTKPQIIQIVIIFSAIIFVFVMGILIGTTARKQIIYEIVNKNYQDLIDEYKIIDYENDILNEIDNENIDIVVKQLSLKPRIAGTESETETGKYIYERWKSEGFDNVQMLDYDVLLAYPHEKIKNKVEILNVNDSTVLKSFDIIEPNYDSNIKGDYLHAFSAYSANGTVTSNEVYYANYGTESDFKLLASKVNLTGKIVLCRFGRLFRGAKAKNAEVYGVSGMLLYDDPDRVAPDGTRAYPNGMFLPDEGIQWGSLYDVPGDPLTPLYPSIHNGYRENINTLSGLTTVVVQAVGYKIALEILSLMQNNEPVPSEWRGDLNVSYTFGGELSENSSVSITVYSNLKVAKTYNVIGVIKGTLEPDHYVMIGAHRDTWSYGAIDDTSGTSILLEMARAFSSIKIKKNWRPRRSIIFCSWGAEEYSLIGSTEWVEEFNKKLSANGIAYLNLDPGVKGNFTFEAESSPLFFELIFDVIKNFNFKNGESVYERWFKSDPNKENTNPAIRPFSGGGDNMPFIQRAGIPIIDSIITRNKNDQAFKKLGFSYPVYHTSYETYNYVKRFIDPDFKLHQLLAKIQTKLLLKLSDSLILPFNCVSYALQLQESFQKFNEKFSNNLLYENITLLNLKSNLDKLLNVANEFHIRLNNIDKKKYSLIRQYNDQLKNFEKSFLDQFSFLERKGYQHVMFSPSVKNSYGGPVFPALSEATFEAINESTENNWNNVRKQLTILIISIQSAISILQEPEIFRN